MEQFQKLTEEPEHIAANLKNFINGFSANGREIIDYFNFNLHIDRLDEFDLLFLVVKEFNTIDLHPDVVSNTEMGYIFEELIRKFSELSNETAGEHFTPREVIKLMVNVLFLNDQDSLTLTVFVRLYAFLAQIMPFADVELEKLYAYARLLLTKLPKQSQEVRLKLNDEVALEYYRILEKDGEAALEPMSEAGMRREKEERARLSEIIDLLNDRFGTEFEEADKYCFRQVEEDLRLNEEEV